ncbi:MAG: hypothetical protein Q8T08_01085 [Ignavibacteria bacterium]|nr:hypothetical protein [Ignavibacteria bacterium]
MIDKRKIVNRIKVIVNEEFTSQTDCANKTGIDHRSLSRMLVHAQVGFDIINKLVDYFPNLNLNWLIYGRGKKYLEDSENVTNEPVVEYKIAQDYIQSLKSEIEHLNNQNIFLQELIRKKLK